MMTSHPPTRGEALIRALMYAFMSASGTWVLVTPPVTIEGIIGTASTIAWGALLVFSAVAAVSSWLGRWRVEYAVLPLLIAGLAIYALAVWTDVPSTITRGPQACILTAFTMGLGTRLMTLHRLAKSKNHHRRSTWNQDGSPS